MSDGISYYQNQNYEQIKAYCLKHGGLFQDEYFPADDSSIAKCQPVRKRISWKRPREFCQNPVFIDNDINPNDLDQGQLGDCWFITGAVAAASVPEYINKVIPSDQTFDDNDYAGIFRFRFWRYGKWVEVVVDDLLPVDDNDTLIYCHNSVARNEMFGPLLEKAYAKLNSCYEFLECGLAIDAMIDMTGGVHESFSLKKKDKTTEEVDTEVLWEIIFKSFERKSLAGSFINTNGATSREQVQSNSLVLGHAYCILEVFEILPNRDRYEEIRTSSSTPGNPNSIRLLRMRNPWGKDQSYKGQFDANSSIWRKISEDIQGQVNARTQIDGQFLIEYREFAAQFDQIDFVHVDFNAFYDSSDDVPNKWTSQMMSGAWVAGKNAGGCGNDDYRNYWLNPQYGFKVPESRNQSGKVSIIAALMQCDQVKNRLKNNGSFSEANIPQSFTIYRINNQDGNLKRKYDERELTEVGGTGIYVGKKEVSKRLDLNPGCHVIIPSLFDRDAESSFLIRLFFETDIVDTSAVEVKKLKYEQPAPQPVPQEQEDNRPVQVDEPDNREIERQDQYVDRGHNRGAGRGGPRGGPGGPGGHRGGPGGPRGGPRGGPGRGPGGYDNGYDENNNNYNDNNRYEENNVYQEEQSNNRYDQNQYQNNYGQDSGYAEYQQQPRRRHVQAPVKIDNLEERGRFSSFLNHSKTISQVQEELSNMNVTSAINYGLSIKNSRACILM